MEQESNIADHEPMDTDSLDIVEVEVSQENSPDVLILENQELEEDDEERVYIDLENYEEFEDTPSTSKAATGKPRKTVGLSQYNRKIILRALKDHGAGKAGYDYLNNKFPNIPREEIFEFINKQASLSQHNVKEECLAAGIKEFVNIESWLDVLKAQKLNLECKSEMAMIFKAIAETEIHPVVSEAEGIDFQKLYRFLSEVMIGQPSTTPEGPTAEFLREVLDEIIDDAKNDKEGLEKMRASLRDNVKGKSLETDFEKSLDPFLLDKI